MGTVGGSAAGTVTPWLPATTSWEEDVGGLVKRHQLPAGADPYGSASAGAQAAEARNSESP